MAPGNTKARLQMQRRKATGMSPTFLSFPCDSILWRPAESPADGSTDAVSDETTLEGLHGIPSEHALLTNPSSQISRTPNVLSQLISAVVDPSRPRPMPNRCRSVSNTSSRPSELACQIWWLLTDAAVTPGYIGRPDRSIDMAKNNQSSPLRASQTSQVLLCER